MAFGMRVSCPASPPSRLSSKVSPLDPAAAPSVAFPGDSRRRCRPQTGGVGVGGTQGERTEASSGGHVPCGPALMVRGPPSGVRSWPRKPTETGTGLGISHNRCAVALSIAPIPASRSDLFPFLIHVLAGDRQELHRPAQGLETMQRHRSRWEGVERSLQHMTMVGEEDDLC